MNSYLPTTKPKTTWLITALALPGLTALSTLQPLQAQAESAPEKTTIGLKYGDYKDSQLGWDRVKVQAAQMYFQAPIAGDWSVDAAFVSDDVSGASPRMHTQRSGASRMSDERKAGEFKITRYMARAAVSASASYSSEHDYVSKALGLQARWSTDDNNRTWVLGYGHASDWIDNQYSGVNTAINQHRTTNEFMAGITQVLTPLDIVQLNLTRTLGSGYFNDPYKSFDSRPNSRNTAIALVRWNHYMTDLDLAARSSYRYYSDTFGVKSHTLGLELAKTLGKWTITPGVRYYQQSAANFYFDPKFNSQGGYDQLATIQTAASITGYKSADQRLSAFGASTLSLKVAYAFTPNTEVDVKVDNYRQSAALRISGTGSPGLDPFNARFVQLGLTHRF